VNAPDHQNLMQSRIEREIRHTIGDLHAQAIIMKVMLEQANERIAALETQITVLTAPKNIESGKSDGT